MDARRGSGSGLASLHGSLFRLDPVMQRYIEVGLHPDPELHGISRFM